ncbi:DUF4760 domain-containing protein [Rhodovulum sulfidophilum]|uniref:DUF4760 domain-containing protein n=1 Tax=Rhodovulum sulfidophilum TaxID=35806 RepID=UPI001F43E7DE|nr:DUF4760 domain-containing protein [Rhodovulum sulfidophilum]MCE8419139.1 DUF4760 domain-containing protein [Rhodovulum sulfidophilum]MCE8438550.1 DUF4760 domain-containing protein [Rhodovulum sulfidophilum]MCE8470206.1 DUF4760 domain-containing protein [Rhodovulum sulfidophilum]
MEAEIVSVDSLDVFLHLAGPLAILTGVFVSALMIFRQMRLNYVLAQENYKIAIRSKSLSYSLYSNEHLRDARIKVEQVFGPMFAIKEAIPMAEINEKIKRSSGDAKGRHGNDTELYASILTLLAHWENMALSIDAGLADDDVCFEMVASTLIQHVKIFRNFIEERRARNPRIYDHLMGLRRRWEERLIRIQRSNFQPILTAEKQS